MNTLSKLSRNILLILLIGIILLSACKAQTTPPAEATDAPVITEEAPSTPPTATVAEEVQQPEELYPAISPAILLDPALADDADSVMLNQLLYEGLVKLDENGEVQPALAKTWVVSDDGLDYIFTLRSNIRFSDGSFITADTIVANFTRWFDPADPLHGNGDYQAWQNHFLGFLGEKDENDHPVSSVDGFQKVDQMTVLIHLNRPVENFLAALADPAFAILSPEALSAYGSQYGKMTSQIISSGAYVVSEWTLETLKLSPNSAYYGTQPTETLSYTLK